MRRVRHFVCGLAAFMAVWAGAFGAQAQSQAPDTAANAPGFEVASVRIMQDRDKLPMAQQMYYMSPSGAAQFTVRNETLTNLIYFAFNLDNTDQIAAMPAWFNSTYYEIAAKPEGDVGLSYDQLRPLLQQLLQERFHLAYHRETRNFKGYALVMAKGGPKLTRAKGAASHAYLMTDRFDAADEPVGVVAFMLAALLREHVVDKTGLKEKYDITLNFAPVDATDSPLPSLFTAVEEQLGLKLVSQTVPVQMFVIDQVDRVPTEN